MKLGLAKLALAALGVLFVFGCNTDSGTVIQPPVSSKKEFTSFAFQTTQNPSLTQSATGNIDPSTKSVNLDLPLGADKTKLVAEFKFEGKLISVNGTPQISGETINDFTFPVKYTITAADWTVRDILVSAEFFNGGSNVTFSEFYLDQTLNQDLNQTIYGVIDNNSKEIRLNVNYGVYTGSLVPTYSLSGPSAVSVDGADVTSGQSFVDFSGYPTVFTLRDIDGEYVNYAVYLDIGLPIFSGNWNIIDGYQEQGLNHSGTANAADGSSASFAQKIFIAWVESNQIRLTAMDENGINFVDGGLSTGLNYSTIQIAKQPTLAEYNGELYIAWVESNGSVDQIRVAKWNGSNGRTMVDGNATDGLNYLPSGLAQDPQLFVFGGSLFAAWAERNGSVVEQIRLKEYNGTSWSWADGAGPDGLNYNVGMPATNPKMAEDFGSLLMTWVESNGTQPNVRVKKWSNSTWGSIDGAMTDGLNNNPAAWAKSPEVFVLNGQVYVTWSENGGAAYQIRIKRWNVSSWSWEDNGGINYNSGMTASDPHVIIFDNKALFTWSESDGTANQIRVYQWDGTSAGQFVDGANVSGINFNAIKNANNPYLHFGGNSIFLVWQETNGGGFDQIRVSMPSFQ